MTPRADFVCLGAKCRTEAGESPTYELPVAAVRCAVCGSKRIRRLFNKVNVIGTRPAAQTPEPDMALTSDSHYARSTALLDHGMSEWTALQSSARRAPSQAQSVSSLGGPGGKSKPLTEVQTQGAIRSERQEAAALARRTGYQKVSAMPGAVEVQRRMNREPIPTLSHHDPREPRAARAT